MGADGGARTFSARERIMCITLISIATSYERLNAWPLRNLKGVLAPQVAERQVASPGAHGNLAVTPSGRGGAQGLFIRWILRRFLGI